jgi:hypothetical protein
MPEILTSSESRYLLRPVINEGDGLYRIPTFRGIKSRDYSDNVTIRVQSSDRLDLLSFDLYGTTRFDWVIATFNNMRFPIAELQNFDTVIAPSKDTLFQVILPALELQLEAFL